MHTDHTLRRRDARRDLGNRERRRIRGEDRVGPHDSLQCGEELELRAEVLDDRFDDKIAVGEVGEIRGEREPLERSLALGRGHPLLIDLPLKEVRDPVARGETDVLRHLAADGLVAGFDRQLRDPSAHGAEANDADSTDLRDGHDPRDPIPRGGDRRRRFV